LWSWVTGKARLIIEYVLLALVVALAGYTVFSFVERKQLIANVSDLSTKLGNVSQTLNQQVAINHDQDAAIAEVKRLRGLDGDAIQGLQKDLATAQTHDHSIRQKLAQLEKNNADARDLLDTAVPVGLGCVLDGQACGSAASGDPHSHPAGAAEPSAPATVHPPSS
jgi:hypothetical protein